MKELSLPTQFGLKYKIKLSEDQQKAMNAFFGHSRVVWNSWIWQTRKAWDDHCEAYDKEDKVKFVIDYPELLKSITIKKQEESFKFLQNLHSRVPDLMLENLKAGYAAFFRNLKNGEVAKRQAEYKSKRKSKGKKVNFNHLKNIGKPQYKDQVRGTSFTLDRALSLDLTNRTIIFPYLKTKYATRKEIKVSILDDDKILKDYIVKGTSRLKVITDNTQEDGIKTLVYVKKITFSRKGGNYYATVFYSSEEKTERMSKAKREHTKDLKNAILKDKLQNINSIDDVLGVDPGKIKVLSFSNGETWKNPLYHKDEEEKSKLLLKIEAIDKKVLVLQNALAKKYLKNKSTTEKWKDIKTNSWVKVQIRIGKLQARRANILNSWRWDVANKVTDMDYLAIAYEGNDIKKMTKQQPAVKRKDGKGFEQTGKKRKSKHTKEMLQIAHYDLRLKIEYLANQKGKYFHVNESYYKSQTCHECKAVDIESRQGELFICTSCGHKDDADVNASLNNRFDAYSKILKMKNLAD